MANPTTNYGFVLPTSSDLVTDLPADFDVALQGVDTRLKALQPGTTLGDLAYSSATANTNTRLGIGSTGNVLTVSGGVPVWSAPVSGSTFAGWSIYKNATQSIANSSSVFMTWQNETYDTDGYHSTVTNTSRATIPSGKAGKYLLVAGLSWANGTTGERYVHIYKNGAAVPGADESATINSFGNANRQSQKCISVLDLAVNDYVEVRVVQTSGGSLDTTADGNIFIGYLIGA